MSWDLNFVKVMEFADAPTHKKPECLVIVYVYISDRDSKSFSPLRDQWVITPGVYKLYR